MQNLTELERVIQENLSTTNSEEKGIFDIDEWGKQMSIRTLEGRKTVIYSSDLQIGRSLKNYLQPVYKASI